MCLSDKVKEYKNKKTPIEENKLTMWLKKMIIFFEYM